MDSYTHHAEKDPNGKHTDDGHHQEQQMEEEAKNEPQFRILEADKNTVESEKMLAKQTVEDLRNLETDMYELNGIFKELKELIDEQQDSLDMAQKNVSDANAYVETAVVDIRDARKMLNCIVS